MGFRKLLIVIGIAAIPLWYVYRTATDKRVLRFDWNLLSTEKDRRQKENVQLEQREHARAAAERKRAEEAWLKNEEQVDAAQTQSEHPTSERHYGTPTEACIGVAQEAELAAHAFREEESRYRWYTDGLLRQQVSLLIDQDDYVFTEVFEREYVKPMSESAINEHLAQVKTTVRTCASAGNDLEKTPYIRNLETEREFFKSSFRRLVTSHSNIRVTIKYLRHEFPDTLKGKVDADSASRLINSIRAQSF